MDLSENKRNWKQITEETRKGNNNKAKNKKEIKLKGAIGEIKRN